MPCVSANLPRSERCLLPDRLTWIDETNRDAHPFLRESDRCLFFGEYYAGKGYQGGGTNQLIFNFKCAPSVARANAARNNYKQQAIRTVASGLRTAISQTSVEKLTWVPIPPSKAVGHADYDDRLMRSLAGAFSGYNADVRLLLKQTASTEADHRADNRLSPDALYDLLEIDHVALNSAPVRQGIALFDDVLTTGKHFKCCERRLREVLPEGLPIIGIFIARRIVPNPFDEV